MKNEMEKVFPNSQQRSLHSLQIHKFKRLKKKVDMKEKLILKLKNLIT